MIRYDLLNVWRKNNIKWFFLIFIYLILTSITSWKLKGENTTFLDIGGGGFWKGKFCNTFIMVGNHCYAFNDKWKLCFRGT